MKFKTTKRAVMDGHDYVIATGYCAVWDLLRLESPAAYTEGVYGWNADVYSFDDINVAITTGPRPFGNLKASSETLEKFKRAACDLRKKTRFSDYYDTLPETHKLISEFIETVKAENGIVDSMD